MSKDETIDETIKDLANLGEVKINHDTGEIAITDKGIDAAKNILKEMIEDIHRIEKEAIASVNKKDYRYYPTFAMVQSFVKFTRGSYIQPVKDEFIKAFETEIENLRE